jgi:hypothetical protein
MSGRSRKNTSFSLERDGKILSDSELVNILNSFYTSVNADIPPLGCSELPEFLPAPDTPLIIEPYQVYKKLCTLQPFKACGPDNITPRILKEFAHEFAEPVATIFNTSLTSETFPDVWKNFRAFPQFQKSHNRLVKEILDQSLSSFVFPKSWRTLLYNG